MNKDFLASPTFKLILLTGMVLQNSATVLVGRYTRTSVPKDELYVVNHLILVTEVGKLLLSCVFEYFTSNGKLMESIQTNILDRPKDALKILVPALLYLVQNSLLYVALSNLTAPIFQVTYQTKLVTTAMVSVVMLNRKYSTQQWICLVVLSIGVAIVVLGESSSVAPAKTSTTTAGNTQSLMVGLMAVTVACVSSALAGVYFEKVIKTAGSEKQKPVSVWMRNIQLAFFTICTAFAQGLWTSMFHPHYGADAANNAATAVAAAAAAAVPNSYFHGFTGWVWLLVALQAGGGLLVAAVIKYADNVLKGLATGVSVCFATLVSTILFGTPLSGQFTVGATAILISVYFFSNPMNTSKMMGGGASSSPSTSSSNSLHTELRPMLPR
jgi:UDP-sugar transporter A1/2/3